MYAQKCLTNRAKIKKRDTFMEANMRCVFLIIASHMSIFHRMRKEKYCSLHH